MTNCQTCKDKIQLILSDLPSLWRDQISESICQAFTDLDEQNCELVNKCQTLTELSEFTRDGSKVCVTYKDEDEISYERCFDFIDIINSLLDGLDPKCLTSAGIWATLTFEQRIQLMIDRACHVANNTIFTTTSTTSTTSTSTTTSSSTTTTTTECLVCGCFSITNIGPSVYPVFYDACGNVSSGSCGTPSNVVHVVLDPGETILVCSTSVGITQSIPNLIQTVFLGDCSLCPATTTTTSSTSTSTSTTSSSTTTTTTDPCIFNGGSAIVVVVSTTTTSSTSTSSTTTLVPTTTSTSTSTSTSTTIQENCYTILNTSGSSITLTDIENYLGTTLTYTQIYPPFSIGGVLLSSESTTINLTPAEVTALNPSADWEITGPITCP